MLIEAHLESMREVVKGLEYYYSKKEWMMYVVLSLRRFCGCEGALSIATKNLSESLRSVSTSLQHAHSLFGFQAPTQH
jgi:hypothetical protein